VFRVVNKMIDVLLPDVEVAAKVLPELSKLRISQSVEYDLVLFNRHLSIRLTNRV